MLTCCDRCPVAEPCLWAAMLEERQAGYRYGVRGGCTAARRGRIAASIPADTDYEAALAAAVAVWADR